MGAFYGTDWARCRYDVPDDENVIDGVDINALCRSAKAPDKAVDLIIQRGEKVRLVSIPYHDGLRFPWLERTAGDGAPAGLDLLLAPRRSTTR